MSDVVHVAVAVIVNQNQEVCISLRHEAAHQGGLWEFPGGKVEAGESIEQAMRREIHEELGLDILHSRPLISIRHDYQDKSVYLHVRKVQAFTGRARGREGQQVTWVASMHLNDYDFPAANTAIIKAMQLPDRYLITGKFNDTDNFIEQLECSLDSGIRLVQLRLKDDSVRDLPQLQLLLRSASELCHGADARLMLNLPAAYLDEVDLASLAYDGLHVDSRTLKSLAARPQCDMFSASCHNADELARAVQLDADFAVLSPVNKTTSHPELDGIGWHRFAEMTEKISIPVYALGGVSEEDMDEAWMNGAQGISAISAFWGKT